MIRLLGSKKKTSKIRKKIVIVMYVRATKCNFHHQKVILPKCIK